MTTPPNHNTADQSGADERKSCFIWKVSHPNGTATHYGHEGTARAYSRAEPVGVPTVQAGEAIYQISHRHDEDGEPAWIDCQKSTYEHHKQYPSKMFNVRVLYAAPSQGAKQ